MDVIENLPDDIRLGDCCDDAQLATALGTVLNLYFEHPLEPLSPGKRSQRTIGFSICI